MKKLKTAFFGTPFFAKEILADLIDKDFLIDLVVTQTDKPAGRKKILQASEVKKFAQQKNLPIRQIEKFSTEDVNFFKKQKFDLIIVVVFGVILPKEILELPRFGCVNVHPSLLPLLRGPSPIRTALSQGFKETGVSIMLLNQGSIDSGPILSQESFTIDPKEYHDSLENKLLQLSKELLLPTLEDWTNGKITPQKQDDLVATQTQLIKKQDGKIDWNRPAVEIFNQYQAFHDWPKVFSYWNNKKLTLTEIDFSNANLGQKKVGQVSLLPTGQTAVTTSEGLIILKKVQPEGKKEMNIKDFINGQKSFVNSTLK